MSERPATTFTGERPGWDRDFDYDEARHLTAYLHARPHAAGKSVLDVGCGEGFGTQTLADVAREVVGVDYSADAIAYCRSRWRKPNLRFEVVDFTRPGPFGGTFDVVLCFQVLEHIADEVAFLEALRARLAPHGTLVLTTPNRLKSFSENPYHLREYAPAELRALLGRVFAHVELAAIAGNEKVVAFDARREQAVRRILRLDPLNLRGLLPAAVVRFAFARLARVVRRSARSDSTDVRIAPEDFALRRGAVEEALDLVALCRP
jgi:2-polyprenyl-3-methyl-5-hydroxy-6-metoxy-1,4-benzoquinol methylase